MGELSVLTDFAKFVLEKIEKATGLAFDPFGAKKEAVDNYIERIKAEKLDPFLEMALISNPRKYMKEYSRQNNILKLAIDELESRKEQKDDQVYSEAEKVDDEWLSRFFDSAKHVADEEIQLIWAKLLADELSSPGTVPKRLISILPYIEPVQAKLFVIICKYSICQHEQIIPFIDWYKNVSYWENQGFTYESLLDLQSIGLITFSDSNFHLKFSLHLFSVGSIVRSVYKYHDKFVILNLKKSSNEIDSIQFDNYNVLFTDVGRALFNAITVEFDEEALNHILNIIKAQEIDVEIVEDKS